MPIVMTTSKREIAGALKETEAIGKRLTIDAFCRLGEEAVKKIRERAEAESWHDITGNLRSSVGYVVTHSGQVVASSDFSTVKGGSEGGGTGRAYAGSLAANYAGADYALIVVAGMDYASYVEAKANKDVLASGELYTRSRAKKVIEDLVESLALAVNARLKSSEK